MQVELIVQCASFRLEEAATLYLLVSGRAVLRYAVA